MSTKKYCLPETVNLKVTHIISVKREERQCMAFKIRLKPTIEDYHLSDLGGKSPSLAIFARELM